MANNLSLFPTKDIQKFRFAWVYGLIYYIKFTYTVLVVLPVIQ